MRIAGIISFVLAALAVIAIVATFPIESGYSSKAKMIQRIEKNASASLFGDEGTPIGSPQLMIIDDQKAFIGGPDDKGVYQVDEKYLKDNNIPPLQLKTVSFVLGMSRLGVGAAALLFAVVGFFLYKKGQSAGSSASNSASR